MHSFSRRFGSVLLAVAVFDSCGTGGATGRGDASGGDALFSASGNTYTATADLALHDEMKTAYASRL